MQHGRGVNDYRDVGDFKLRLAQHLDQLLTRIRDVSLGTAPQKTTALKPCWTGDPYPGLRSFEPEEAPIFFGRNDETSELVRWIAAESTSEGEPSIDSGVPWCSAMCQA